MFLVQNLDNNFPHFMDLQCRWQFQELWSPFFLERIEKIWLSQWSICKAGGSIKTNIFRISPFTLRLNSFSTILWRLRLGPAAVRALTNTPGNQFQLRIRLRPRLCSNFSICSQLIPTKSHPSRQRVHSFGARWPLCVEEIMADGPCDS